MAEIIVGLLGPLIEVGKCLVPPVKRQFNYLCCFNNTVKRLRDDSEKLDKENTCLEEKVNREKIDGKRIVSEITDWQRNYTDMKAEVEKINADIGKVQRGCLGIKSRYELSKKTDKVIKDINELVDKCKTFPVIAQSPPPASMVPAPLKDAHEFPSRKQIEDDAMQALRENNVPIMGICGMGGLGKTTMADKIMHRARDEKLFGEFVKVAVSKDIDMLSIQQQLAESLGLELKEKTLHNRAHKLRERLSGNKRILIVMDDIWGTLEFQDLGIPCESSGGSSCTILLTSRSNDVLKQMNALVFTMEKLEEEEAWSLFKSKVGEFVDDKNLVSTAKKVAKECNGLPLALKILGSSLKGKKEASIWEDTLRQLKDSNLENIPDILKTVYPSLRKSYENLDNSAVRCLLLLCSQFPEDSNVSLEDLAMYSLSLRMFGRINVEETRDRVSAVVDQLKNRSLLLDGTEINSVKMHDVVRDVAIVIARDEKLVDGYQSERLVDADQGYNSVIKCQWMFMFPTTCDEIGDHLLGSSYPRLRLLAIERKQSWGEQFLIKNLASSLDEMEELCSLSLDAISIKSLPRSLKYMKNLRMLRLEDCNFKCMSIVGELLGLEILVCWLCDKITELPLEIGGLKKVKLLKFCMCRNLEKIAPGVISNLTELEELTIWDSFSGWESKTATKDECRNASLEELECLTKLTLLRIHIKDVALVQQKLRLPQSIKKYKILVGEEAFGWICHSEKSLCLNGLPQHILCQDWIQKLVSTAGDLCVNEISSRNFDMGQLGNNIVSLHIEDCEVVEAFASSLNNLRTISISGCNKLRNLFQVEKAMKDACFFQLKELCINKCEMMEEVLYDGGAHNYQNIFPKLEVLILVSLSSLTTVAKGIESIELALLRELWIADCPKLIVNNLKVVSGSLKELCISEHKFSQIWCSQTSSASFEQLEKLAITDDSDSIIWNQHFVNIKDLCVENSKAMERIIINEVFFQNFPALEGFKLQNLPKLEEICDTTLSVGPNDNALHHLKTLRLEHLPALKHPLPPLSLNYISIIVIQSCDELRNLFSWKMSKNRFLKLRYLRISSCNMMEHVFSNEENGNSSTHISFSNLMYFDIRELTSLKTMFHGVQSIDFPKLKEMNIYNCPNLRSIVGSTDGDGDGDGEGEDHSCHLIDCPKVAFHSLEGLEISGCDKINNIWCHQIPTANYFRKLKKLQISHCGGIKVLFSSKIVENLVNLEELYIEDCRKMEKVIGDIGEVHENYRLFPSLIRLELDSLDSLKMFCEWDCSVVLPLLRYIRIDNCPCMEVLALRSLRAPNLVDIYIDGIENEEHDEIEDLNILIRQHIGSRAKEATSIEIMEEKEEKTI